MRLRGTVADRAHARAARRREAVEARCRRALRQRARRADRQPGDAAGQGRPEGDLPVRLAGRGRRQHRRRDVSGPVAVSGQLGAAGRQAHQQHASLRADQIQHAEGKDDIDYLRADRRRCRSRLRRRAERLRADEGDDRGRRRRRALRGPARLGEEVRPHGRQGAGADARSGREADRRAPRRRRAWACRRCCSRAPTPKPPTCVTSDVDDNDKPFCTGERTVEGFYKTRNGPRPGDLARPRLRAVRRPGLVRDRQARPRVRARRSPRRSTRSSRASCWPTTARRRSTGRRTSTTRPSRSSSASSARWATSSSSSRWPASTALNYSMFNLAHGYARNSMSAFVELQEAEFAAAEQGLHRGQAPARGRHRLLRRGDADDPGRAVLDRGAEGLDRGRAVPPAPQAVAA